MASQFFLKTSQDIELFQGYPSFTQSVANSTGSGVTSSILSPCSRFLALSTKEVVKVYTGDLFDKELLSLPLTNVYDLNFSPSGNYLSTWERPSAQDEGHQNCKVWYLNKELDGQDAESIYQYRAKTQNGWSLQFSKLDNYAIKHFGKELRIVKLEQNNPVFDFDHPFAVLSHKQESESQLYSTFLISPAEHPTICTFTPEKSGKPARLTIWPIIEGIITKKIVTKTFFKADSCQLQWNSMGNAVLCVAITDFDSSNQSYYGENTLYLLSFQGVNGSLGGNSVRVPLSKEGPIHDFTWSPTSRQFGVIYGYMPATITFFDLRANIVHSLEAQAKNTMLFSPSGRYILIAGFGNLQGAVDILDRHDKFKRISHFVAANTSVCKWSPGGEFIMTATTSPRLRVDNCIKIWHVTGKLVFVKEFKELLKVDWRTFCPYKMLMNSHIIKDWQEPKNDISQSLDPKLASTSQLEIHESAEQYAAKHPKSNGSQGSGSQSKGAYKPPHARKAGANGGRNVPGMNVVNAKPQPKSQVPGLVPGVTQQQGGSKSAAKNKKRANKKKEDPQPNQIGQQQRGPQQESSSTEEPALKESSSPEEKKIRSLLKKLRAIEALKQRQSNGEKLEDTQVLKIQSEEKVLSELKFMGWQEESLPSN